MPLHSLLKVVFFLLTALGAGLFTLVVIRMLVRHSLHKLWFAFCLLAFVSLLLFFTPKLYFLTNDLIASQNVQLIVNVSWWLALDYFLYHAIEYWIWGGMYLKRGIVIAKIVKDFVFIIVLLLTAACIMNFVFSRPVTGLFAASGVVALFLGYAARETLSDVFSGLGLNLARAFREGDWIRVTDKDNQYTGKVMDINWRVVKLVTKENNYLFIPNAYISRYPVVNLSWPEKKRYVVLRFQLQKATSPAVIKKILLSAAAQSIKVLKTPAPRALLVHFSGLEYELSYYTKEMNEQVVNDEILAIVWYMCNREHIMPFIFEHSHGTTSEEEHALTHDESEALIGQSALEEFLKTVDLFQSLNKRDLRLLAAGAILHSYGPPERVLEQGQENTSLYILYSGSANVLLTESPGKPFYLTTLYAPQYFGEMSLLTGKECNASVIIREESVIIEIDHENIAKLFAKRPELMEKISKVVVYRNSLNEHIQVQDKVMRAVDDQTLIDRLAISVSSFFEHKEAKNKAKNENKSE